MSQDRINRSRFRCKECGAPFFQEAEFRQYSVVPSAEPGGGVQPGEVVCRARVCICGDVMLLGMGAGAAVPDDIREEFARAAERHRARIDMGMMRIRLVCEFVPRTEFDAVVERVAGLQQIFQGPC